MLLVVGSVSAPSSWFSKFLKSTSKPLQNAPRQLLPGAPPARLWQPATDLATQNGKNMAPPKKALRLRRFVCVFGANRLLLTLYHQHPIGCFCFERLICRLCVALRASISGPSRAQDLVQSGTCWVVRVASNIILPDPPRSASFTGQYSIYPFCISFINESIFSSFSLGAYFLLVHSFFTATRRSRTRRGPERRCPPSRQPRAPLATPPWPSILLLKHGNVISYNPFYWFAYHAIFYYKCIAYWNYLIGKRKW